LSAPTLVASEDSRLQRRARLRDVLEERALGGLLSVHAPNIRYLSGFSGSSGLLVVSEHAADLFTDSRYEEQAAEELDSGVELHVVRDGLFSALGEVAERWRGGAPIGLETAHLTVRDGVRVREAASDLEWSETEGIVEALRARKDAGEIETIGRAGALACAALEQTLGLVREGMTELEITAELEYRLRLAGSEGPAFESIVAAGPRSALPHARPGPRPLREGDLLLLDFGAVVEGYRSDVTRTVVAGRPADWQTAIHSAVLAAHDAAVAVAAAGVLARDVDRTARERLVETGYGEYFGHSTGHGLGLEVHEGPSLSHRSGATLEPGNVVTIEPGVYLPGRGGVRLEDDLAIGEGDARLLTEFPLALREI
jgi:Xaa-Pro aminopeptidase